MTQNKQNTLLDSIQSEVSREASPMLEFLVKHARKIFAGLIAFIVLLAGFGAWTYYDASQKREVHEALGKILLMPEAPEKIAALEAFAATSAPKTKNAALMALANSAMLQSQPEKAAAAWAEVAQTSGPATKLAASLAQAGSLSAQGKNSEALALLEGLAATAPVDAQPTINAQIAGVAELLGEWDKAIAACDAIIRQLSNQEAKNVWEQRLAYFVSKK